MQQRAGNIPKKTCLMLQKTFEMLQLFIIINFVTIKFPHCPLPIKKLTLVKTIKRLLNEQSFINTYINNSF